MVELLEEEEMLGWEEAAERLINGRPVTVYHILHSAADFETVKEEGFKGAYTCRDSERKPILDADGDPITVTYFLLSLEGLDMNKYPREMMVKLRLNSEGEILKIADQRQGGVPNGELLYQQGFNGTVRQAGVFTPLNQKCELALFGKNWGKRITGL